MKRRPHKITNNKLTDSIHTLAALFSQGRYAEGGALAKELTVRFPQNGAGWKALGVMLLLQGRSAEALGPMRKAAELLPGDAEAHNNLGNTLKVQGRLSEAEVSYRQALSIRPDSAAHNNLGNTLKVQGRLSEAEVNYRQALSIRPDFAEAHNNLGVTLKAQARLVEAEVSYRQALSIKPDYVEAHNNLGNTLKVQGRLSEAEASYRQALSIKPDYVEAHNNLGNTLKVQGRLSEAEASYRQALSIRPDFAESHNNLGNALQEQGRLAEAEASYRQALSIKPDYAESHNNLGNALQEQGRLAEAEASYRRALSIRPDHAETHSNLGVTLRGQGRLAEAEASYRQALSIRPDYAEAHSNLGITLQEQGRLSEAEASYRRALSIRPDHAEAHSNLGVTLRDQGRLSEAEASYRQALSVKSDYAEAHNNLGVTLRDQGRLTEAEASYRRALSIRPDYAEAHSNLLFILAHNGAISPEDYLAQARDWDLTAATAEERRAAKATSFHSPPRQGRRLKIGYVSGDFRQHSVNYFIEELFCGHNRDRCEIFAYSTCPRTDAVTSRLQKTADHWTQLVGLTDAAATEHIRQDGIDVLIDLSGHTAHNRLKIFANRSAPVQAHYLGFFASTGLAEMDYWIGDATLIPESESRYYSEKIWHLPRIWINYHAGDAAPAPAWQPDPSRLFWFGSFNNLYKITRESIVLWSRILRNCPQGRLLLKTGHFVDPMICEGLLKAFAAHGVPSERISLIGKVPDWREHMALYNRLDVVLDPVGGVCGGTTTCDALWMGAPVITRADTGMARRMSASILTSLGRTEWIAESADAYVEKAISLAEDVVTRRDLRLRQREEMKRSPLCDSQGLVQALEDAYEKMFDLWEETRK